MRLWERLDCLSCRNAKSAYSYQANEKLNIACVGVGGHGWSNLMAVSSENIVALCDVDEQHASQAFNRYPDVPPSLPTFGRCLTRCTTKLTPLW